MLSPTLILDVAGERASFRQVVYSEGESALAVRQVETVAVDPARIERLSTSIFETLDRAAREPGPAGAARADLEKLGGALWDLLLGPAAKQRLRSAEGGFLVLLLDETFVAAPWEMLHDGSDFLCQRLAIGRIVRTGQTAPTSPARRTGPQRSVLMLANPTGDLPEAAREQEQIRAALKVFGSSVRVRAKARDIRRDFVFEQLRDHDVAHYSGHAQFDPQSPAKSGWLLSDGVFSALDILKLAGSERPMPALVFANACCSGRATFGQAQLSLFNFFQAFLLAGTRHFIGSICLTRDEVAAEMGAQFYRRFFQGASVGESLLKARQETARKLASSAPCWLGFVLYGDPRQSPFANAETREAEVEMQTRSAPRCAVCQTEILSRLKGAWHPCEECALPICDRCWTWQGVRVCPAHQAASTAAEGRLGPPAPAPQPWPASPGHEGMKKEAEKKTLECGQCGRSISLPATQARPCAEPGCEALICARCARWIDLRYCKDHSLPWEKRLEKARGDLQAGRIEILIDRAAARQREDVYSEEIARRLRGSPEIQIGEDRYKTTAASLAASSYEEDLRRLLETVSSSAGIEERCPRNRWIETRFKRVGLLTARGSAVLRIEILSDLEQQIFPGFETVPRGAEPVQRRCELLAGETFPPGTFLLHVLASTTGWSEEARRVARGEAAAESRADSPWAVALVDLERDDLIYSPAHSRFIEILELLRPSPRISIAARIESYVRENLVGKEAMTAAGLAERFQTSPGQVHAVFRALAFSGEFREQDIEGVGRVLTKKYEE